MEDLAAAQLQQQSIDKEIMLQIARVNTAVSEFESFKASSAEMKRQLEKEALDSEMALVDLQHRFSRSQSELISAKLEVGETLEVARRKAERAAVYKTRHSEMVSRLLHLVRLQEDLQESLVKTQAPPDTAAVQARPLPAVARPYLLASYSEDDVLGVIDGDSFLA
jgi:hypothetical protein